MFSLVDNRLGGHVQRGGGLVVVAGSAGFAKYLRFAGKTPGWEMRRDAGGVKVATMRSKAANIHVPLTAEQAASSVIRVRAQSPAPQRLGVRVNNRRDKEVAVELAAGWSTAELAVPAGALVAGENEVVFFAGKNALDVAWIQVGGKAGGRGNPGLLRRGEQEPAPARRRRHGLVRDGAGARHGGRRSRRRRLPGRGAGHPGGRRRRSRASWSGAARRSTPASWPGRSRGSS